MLEKGSIVEYRLLPCQRPTNPSKLWRAKLIRYIGRAILVELVEPGYVGLTELVKAEQIVTIDEIPQRQVVGLENEVS